MTHQTTTVPVTINVLDADDQNPAFKDEPYIATIMETAKNVSLILNVYPIVHKISASDFWQKKIFICD